MSSSLKSELLKCQYLIETIKQFQFHKLKCITLEIGLKKLPINLVNEVSLAKKK